MLFLLTALVALLVAAWFFLKGKKTHVKHKHIHFNLTAPTPEVAVVEDKKDSTFDVNFGHYKQPIPFPNIQDLKPFGNLSPLRLKQWSHHHLYTADYFMAFVVGNMGYAAFSWFFVLDRKTNVKYKYENISILGKALQSFAPSSVKGVTQWADGPNSLRISFENNSWKADVDVAVTSENDPRDQRKVKGTIITKNDLESMAMLYNLTHDRPAYTHKASTLATAGQVQFGEQKVSLSEGMGSLDWTVAYANRTTEWFWASLGGVLPDGRRFGGNFSAKVYGNKENAIWLEGRVYSVDYVRFVLPDKSQKLEEQVWKVHTQKQSPLVEEENPSSVCVSVSLEFRPVKEEVKRENKVIVQDSFTQCYGYYSGFVVLGEERIDIENMFGVAEDHTAVW